eukprot:NODE_13520_length_1161_cov_2.569632.p1 GENE.NODE_13520_length_1161_cov_2.569632~~NODE_13520_length_1161_cov_2.569632.p1  ORF type:complete len:341 (-),score=34.60 NODE_13520_length_1161_cov_2.569632:37-1059(-)
MVPGMGGEQPREHGVSGHGRDRSGRLHCDVKDPLGVQLWRSWTAIFEWLHFKVAKLAPKHLLGPKCGGRMRDLGVKVFVMPGGDTQEYAGITESRDHVQAFINGGGLFVGSCGGFGYLSSVAPNLGDLTHVAFVEYSTYLDILGYQEGPVWYVGFMSPLPNETAADSFKKFGPYSKGGAVLTHLSDGLLGGYAGGFPAMELPKDAEVLQRFDEVDRLPGGAKGQPMASVHVHGSGRNVLGFVYHPEFEWGLPNQTAWDTGLFGRILLQDGDTHNLPMIQLKMWQYFGEKLLSAMQEANLPVSSLSKKIPDTLRYRRFDGVTWKMVEGKNELVPEEEELMV